MPITLNARKRKIKSGYSYVFDVVLLMARMEKGLDWPAAHLLKYLPCYQPTKKMIKTGPPAKFFVRNSFERTTGRFELFYEEIVVPDEVATELLPVVQLLEEKLLLLVQFVLDEKIVGRLEPPRSQVVGLNSTYGHIFRAQRSATYCTSFLRLEESSDARAPALLTFDEGGIRAVVAQNQGRRWGNQASRALSPSEKINLSKAISELADASLRTGLTSGVTIPSDKLVELLAKRAGIPLAGSAETLAGVRPVAVRTLAREISSNPSISSFRCKRGSPSESEIEIRQSFLAELGWA